MTGQPTGDDFPTQEAPRLEDEAFDDDLEEQLRALAPRKIATRTTLVLAGIVLVVAGFLGGIFTQKEFGSTSGGSSDSGTSRNVAGGAAASAMAGQRGGASGAPVAQGGQDSSEGSTTTGTVKKVDGTTVYIETSDGTTITVKTTTETTVESTETSSLSELAVGTEITVEGTGTETTINATKVTKDGE